MNTVAIVSLVTSVLCALTILVDVFHRPQRMKVMNVVWPITALYAGPLALLAYFTIGHDPRRGHDISDELLLITTGLKETM
ncbi:MAG: hypothetical protein ABI718_18210 [Acidobacteriota bacterium]